MISCPACKKEMFFLFKAKVLNRYDVSYFQCPSCRFIRTEKPYWLQEAYSEAISSLDVGLVKRNIVFSTHTEKIINKHFNPKGSFLDFAGGYGLFVRLMRDKGFEFYRQDVYCKNIFAVHHDLADLKMEGKFELITAFEVFEHLENPEEGIASIFDHGDSILFSTELLPEGSLKKVEDWWYFVPETGQHIAFYTKESLWKLAEKFNCFFYSDGKQMHLFSKKELPSDPFKEASKSSWFKKITRRVPGNLFRSKYSDSSTSLLEKDFELAKKKLREGKA